MQSISIITSAALVTACAGTDLHSRRIPNLFTLPMIVFGIGYHLSRSGVNGLYFSLAGLTVGVSLLIIPYMVNAMGAGDVKLLAAIGSVVGAVGVFKIFLYSSIFGGVIALFLHATKQYRFKNFGDIYQTLKHLLLYQKYLPIDLKLENKRSMLCYGLAIAVGTYTYIIEATEAYRLFI
jgi:prepilin peptidase CpaA